jgi:8-oxo-dGTP diphosphatase
MFATTKYVVGFLFDPASQQVVVIQKVSPKWQAGKFNGVGGKIEDGETPYEAMVREFAEETGVQHNGWEQYAILRGIDWVVHVFRSWGDVSQVATLTVEPVSVIPVKQMDDLDIEVIPNLRWLIPLALDKSAKQTETLA